MSSSAIEWTDEVWNPVTGCDRVSPGCAHCYALELAPRLRAMGSAKYQRARDGGKASGPAFGVTLHPDVLEEPLHWRRPRRVFVNSMSDLFHEEVSNSFIAEVYAVMALAPRHTFQVLTKRPERMCARVDRVTFIEAVQAAMHRIAGEQATALTWPLPNVWLGVTIENRRYVNRADMLRDTLAAVRFVSAEPLLGPLMPLSSKPVSGQYIWPAPAPYYTEHRPDPGLDLTGIDWLIVGGESGPHHRPMDVTWARRLLDACLEPRWIWDGDEIVGRDDSRARTRFFFKQWGGRTPKAGGRELDGDTWDEFPDPITETGSDFDDDAVAREREATAERRKQERP